jgi:hypothetical protein
MKTRTLTAVLAWYLGVFGADYFYKGDKKMGIIVLLATILTWWIGGLPLLGMWIWGAVRAIMIWKELYKEETANGEKSTTLAAVLAALLGEYGADFFYQGNKKMGIIALLATLLLWWVGGLPYIVTTIWGYVRAYKLFKEVHTAELAKA